MIHSAYTSAAATGFTTTAGASKLIKVDVDADKIAATGYGYCRLEAVEVVNNPVLGGIVINLPEPRYGKDIQATAIV